jgi:hypothetical protein
MKINEQIAEDQKTVELQEEIRNTKSYPTVDAMFDAWENEWANRNTLQKIKDFCYYDIWYHGIKRIYYAIKQRFRQHHIIKTTLSPWEWCDTDYRMLYGNMELFMQFLREQKPFERVYYDSDPEHQDLAKKIKIIEQWWLNYPNRLKEIEQLSDIWYYDLKKNDKTEKNLILRDKWDEAETKLLNEEQEMLHLLIDIRRGLWV